MDTEGKGKFPKGNIWKGLGRTFDGIKVNPEGKKPEGLKHAETETTAPKDIR